MSHIKLLFAIILMGVFPFHSEAQNQTDIKIAPIWTLNTEADEILCCLYKESLILTTNTNNVIVEDQYRNKDQFTLFAAKDSIYDGHFSIEDPILEKIISEDIGSCFYDQNSKTLWFSSAYNFNGDKGSTIKLYSIRKIKNSWTRPSGFEFNSEKFSTAHPWMNAEGTQLFFSSNREGGAGKMDIWFCNKIGKRGWSDPIWAGEGINSSANEIFPTFHEGDIYFSSDRNSEMGLDIYRAFKIYQWEEIEKLREPLNSMGDDLQMVFRDSISGFFTSNRQFGQGGDDIYSFEVKERPTDLNGLSFLLELKKTPLQNTQVLITDENDVLHQDLMTDENGQIPLDDFDFEKLKKIYILDIEDRYLKDCILYLLDKEGNKIRSYAFGENGFFAFEYLPIDYIGAAPRLSLEDESVLTLMLDGQVFKKSPGDIGEGEPVYITDEKGNLLALSYTSESGNFSVPALTPLKDYYFKFDDRSGIQMIRISDQTGNDTFPVSKGRTKYTRLSDKESIRLVDENRNPIFVGPNEVFIIKNIYYIFDESELNEIAKNQLSDLATILRNNPIINIELSSHTDSRGTNMYNYNLSNKRANIAANYLSGLGVDRDRVLSKGYGEVKLINHCENDVECTEMEHALNRRTEIKIFIP